MKHCLSLSLALLTMAVFLTACGIKPSSLSPPDPEKGKHFPRTYPDLSTDPLPGASSPPAE